MSGCMVCVCVYGVCTAQRTSEAAAAVKKELFLVYRNTMWIFFVCVWCLFSVYSRYVKHFELASTTTKIERLHEVKNTKKPYSEWKREGDQTMECHSANSIHCYLLHARSVCSFFLLDFFHFVAFFVYSIATLFRLIVFFFIWINNKHWPVKWDWNAWRYEYSRHRGHLLDDNVFVCVPWCGITYA